MKRPFPVLPEPENFNMTPMIDIVFQLLIFFMLTMNFREIEGKLLSQLPKGRGTADQPALPLPETRLTLCAGGDFQAHVNHKGAHDRQSKPGGSCRAFAERIECGRLFRTESNPDRGASNREVYRALAARAREIHSALGDAHALLVLDADNEVPYEHVIGVVNACQEQGLTRVEFAGDPRCARLR